jgi:hypothetical protein
MKKNILNFKENSLARSEMKNIKGGVENPDDGAGVCLISSTCSLYIRAFEMTFPGSCYWQIGGRCYCSVSLGGNVYITDPSTTSMCVIY